MVTLWTSCHQPHPPGSLLRLHPSLFNNTAPHPNSMHPSPPQPSAFLPANNPSSTQQSPPVDPPCPLPGLPYTQGSLLRLPDAAGLPCCFPPLLLRHCRASHLSFNVFGTFLILSTHWPRALCTSSHSQAFPLRSVLSGLCPDVTSNGPPRMALPLPLSTPPLCYEILSSTCDSTFH